MIPWTEDYKVIRYRPDKSGAYIALLVNRGVRWLYIIPIKDEALRVKKINVVDERWITPVIYKGGEYPVGRAIRHLKSFAKAFGATKRARRYINAWPQRFKAPADERAAQPEVQAASRETQERQGLLR